MSKLTEAQVLDVVTRIGPRCSRCGDRPPGRAGLFPALNADIWLTAAGERSARLSPTGVHRPSLGALWGAEVCLACELLR